jgi:hypothetical protein
MFSLIWFILWLPKEVFFLLLLPHRENEEFFFLMKNIDFCNVYPRLELSIASRLLSLP